MPSDNNQEMFPIVDEQGNITGAATRGECHSGSKLASSCHPSSRFQYRKEIYICRNVRNGKTSSPENGTQPLADILTWAKV